MLQEELGRNKCRNQRIAVWPRAVDTEVFSPRHRSQSMRSRMTGGHPERTVVTYVGRIGAGELEHLCSALCKVEC